MGYQIKETRCSRKKYSETFKVNYNRDSQVTNVIWVFVVNLQASFMNVRTNSIELLFWQLKN